MKKIVCGVLISIMALSSVCFANVQSRPDRARLVSQTANQFFIKSRNMEASGGVLGLSATINQDTGLETSGSNNIDAHMVKNTEYGAAAILAVSQYGYQAHAPEVMGTYTSATNYTLGDSTTGASGTESYYYGLFDMANINRYTYTATAHRDTTSSTTNYSYSSILNSAAQNNNLSKYVDYYPNPATGINYFYGDATTETSRWRGATYAYFVSATIPVFLRSGGMFSYNNFSGSSSSGYGSRAVVVCGSGL